METDPNRQRLECKYTLQINRYSGGEINAIGLESPGYGDRGDTSFSNLLSLKGASRHLLSLVTMVAIQSLESVPVSLQKHIAHLESQLRILVEKQAITDLLNSYAEELDKCGADTSNWSRGWEGNFHPDAHIAYPFGERHGGKEVGKWASATMKQFINYHHLS